MPRLLPLLTGLLLTACANGGGPTTPQPPILEVRLTFAAPVNPSQFEYFLIFTLSDDEFEAPLVDQEGFENREVMGLGWDVYYLLGTPGGSSPGFYRGQGGTDANGDPRTDVGGDLLIERLPTPVNSAEILETAMVNGIADPDDPDGPVVAGNTILYRFDLEQFPSLAGFPNNPVRLRMATLVTDRGIDAIDNPDDGLFTARLYDRFLSGALTIDLGSRTDYREASDPEETIEEIKPAGTPPLTGPFRAADLTNWSVRVIQS